MTENEIAFTKKPKEYQKQVIDSANALMTLKQSSHIGGISLKMSLEESEFSDDLTLVYTTLVQHETEEKCCGSNEACSNCGEKEDNWSEDALMQTVEMMKEMAIKMKSMSKAIQTHEQAIAYLLKNQ